MPTMANNPAGREWPSAGKDSEPRPLLSRPQGKRFLGMMEWAVLPTG